MRMTIHGEIQVEQHGLEIDVPAEVVKEGHGAILQWLQNHIRTVNYASVENQQTFDLTHISGFELED